MLIKYDQTMCQCTTETSIAQGLAQTDDVVGNHKMPHERLLPACVGMKSEAAVSTLLLPMEAMLGCVMVAWACLAPSANGVHYHTHRFRSA